MAQKVVIYVFITVWFCLRAEFPVQSDFMVPCGLRFMVSLRFFCPLPKTVLKPLEALKRYLSIVINLFLGLKLSVRSAGEHLLQPIFLRQTSRNQQSSKEDKKSIDFCSQGYLEQKVVLMLAGPPRI